MLVTLILSYLLIYLVTYLLTYEKIYASILRNFRLTNWHPSAQKQTQKVKKVITSKKSSHIKVMDDWSGNLKFR